MRFIFLAMPRYGNLLPLGVISVEGVVISVEGIVISVEGIELLPSG